MKGSAPSSSGWSAEVFGLRRPEMGTDWYSFTTCAQFLGSLATNAGLNVERERGYRRAALGRNDRHPRLADRWRAPIRPVAGRVARGRMPEARGWCRYARGRSCLRRPDFWTGGVRPRIGATPIACGRPIRLSWSMQTRFMPGDGQVFTSAGSAAGIDLLLHLVRTDFGAAAANSVARRFGHRRPS